MNSRFFFSVPLNQISSKANPLKLKKLSVENYSFKNKCPSHFKLVKFAITTLEVPR